MSKNILCSALKFTEHMHGETSMFYVFQKHYANQYKRQIDGVTLDCVDDSIRS